MRVSLDNLLQKPNTEVLVKVKEDAEQLKERVVEIEKEYSNLTSKELKLLEAANALCFTRWPNGNNIKTFVDYPDGDLLKLFYDSGVYDIHKDKSSATHMIQPGINNPYISWPLVFSFYSAVHTARQQPKKTRHLKNIEAFSKYFPGVKLDLKHDEFISRLCAYKNVGEKYREQFIRGMLFSLPGELFQNSIGIAEESELRGTLLGLLVLDDILKEGGMKKLERMKLSEFMDMSIDKLEKIREHVSRDIDLLKYFDHFEYKKQKEFSRATLKFLEIYMSLAEKYITLRKLPGLSYFYRNVRSSTDGYSRLEFGKFPEKKPTNYPDKIKQIFPQLSQG